ncbi:glycosyl transferase family 9 [Gloeocapsa sp. PCC 7428]|uniref:glycosyltransferase family 9 protein n=1 Tax=Gloeocapsa sp. PCC 7428 TaxID=1173026 RepID=UPI0002A5BC2B|nr:glycosyl transferase family 9 [Gloeocapsa sp. PCC 7428]AFZ32436.1 glycosyl transferase family 9 [Gloeocapsa sp. PCC 7428]
MQIDWQEVKRLLVVVVGDPAVMPALHRLKILAHAKITLLATQHLADTAGLCAIFCTTNWVNVSKETGLVKKLCNLRFNAAIIFTAQSESPYPLAYLCYLAGIPIRVGQSKEFGGSVLSHWIKPPLEDLPKIDPHLYLLDAVNFPFTVIPDL